MSLEDKVAIVTGASSGIGAAIAEKFSLEGAKVVLVGRNEKKLRAVATKCINPLVILAELGNEDDIVHITNKTVKRFGKIDILVNNAGTNFMGSVLNGDLLKSYDEVMKINFRSIVHLTKLSAPELIRSKGCILNISSINAQQRSPAPILMMYSASKAALDHFSKDVALELAPHKVRVNVISPGPVRTDILQNTNAPLTWEEASKQTALNRISEAEEIAELALYLVSDKAKAITGSIFVSDNGALLKK